MTKLEILKQYFGHEKFRSGQEDIIDNILSGKDVTEYFGVYIKIA